ncbi:hypothetical protein [Streptomyces leeuwenhoekii]|uniref:Sle1_097 protein n=1 Tax=Streptomyces leeuwenhoekii TaxID=1437453 RepID=A0A0F7VKK5_STRLW|nr:hypothetical protein [Streptomyces leeuwenhoekii]CQR59264.1 sle1_097 [Streptomyces leeuwenhoekii]
MTATATVTVDSLIAQHADNLAYVAENPTPATNLTEFLHHLDYAVDNFHQAGINGHDDLQTAGTLLSEAANTEGDTREGLLLRAAVVLEVVRDMTDEYRTMVGD